MKKKIDISGAMAAEAALARKESEALENELNNLPEGELKNAILKEKGKLEGDLAGLPVNHPLRQALEEAKLRYEQRMETFADEESQHLKEQEDIKVRRATRVEAKKVQTEKRRRDDEREQVLREATKRINSSMSETMDSLKRLNDNIEASHEDFAKDQYAQMKLERLSRLIGATMRGISESKINAGRVVSNGR